MNHLVHGTKFKKVRHNPKVLDAQPSGTPGGVLCQVTGQLFVDDEPNPLLFSQTFHLLPGNGGGNFWVANDIFRLVTNL